MDFLSTLLTPILPVHILNSIVSQYETEGDANDQVIQQLLFTLPKDNSMAFVYLLSFFREMLSCSEKNKLTPEKISEILCECLVGEDKLTKSNSKKFRRENLVRADASFFAIRRKAGSLRKTGTGGEENEEREEEASESGNLSIE